MKILYVHRTAGTRVEGVHIREMANAFRALGHEVRLVNPPGCDPMRAGGGPEAESSGGGRPGIVASLPHRLPAWMFELLELGYSVGLLLPLLVKARRYRPDFIYERTAPFQFAATLVGKWLRVPVVQEVNQTVRIGRLRPAHLERCALAVERWVFARSALLLTVSGRFREMMIADGAPAGKIAVIPNAADVERFRPDAPIAAGLEQDGTGGLTLGYVGSFVSWHELDRLLELAEKQAVRLLLVGDGPERARLMRRAEEMGLKYRAIFPGAVAHDRLPGYVRAMDVAVMANATEYASPVKLFEYMAMGKAVVAPRVAAVAEVARDGETALLFAPGDSGALLEAVRRIVSDAPLRERLGRNAREYVVHNRTWRNNAERTLELMRQRSSSLKEHAE